MAARPHSGVGELSAGRLRGELRGDARVRGETGGTGSDDEKAPSVVVAVVVVGKAEALRNGKAESSGVGDAGPRAADSEDSVSTFPDAESTVSSGRSTPALTGAGVAAGPPPAAAATPDHPLVSSACVCRWDKCQATFAISPDLADHIRTAHVDRQESREVFVCLWKGCKVYNTPSSSQSWLQRHVLSHSGDKPFKCVIDGCTATFASQMGLARHVPTHFSSSPSGGRPPSQPRLKEESPSKALGGKRKRLRCKRRFSLPKPDDFFDAQMMDTIRHRLMSFNLNTQVDSQGGGHSVVFHSAVVARRKDETGKVKVLLHWTPEDILPDVWVSENDSLEFRTKLVHLSKLPKDSTSFLDPNIYRAMPQKRYKRK